MRDAPPIREAFVESLDHEGRGVSRVDGKTAGDLAADVWEKAAWVTPNPGGVGPMTRAMLLSNVVDRAEALAASRS